MYKCIGPSQIKLMNQTRLLWEQHGNWTGMAITSISFKLPNEDAVTARLLRNPKDFETFLKPFYGEKVASKFEKLLTEHLQLAAQFIKAQLAGNCTEAMNFKKEWYRNANEISAFLASINPFWSERLWRNMFYEHLCVITTQFEYYVNKCYKAAVDSQDFLEKGVLMMADIMYEGLVKQFHKCFMNQQ